MVVFIMLITFLSILAISHRYNIKNTLIFTLCLWSCLVFSSIEFLSLFHALTSRNITIFWSICVLICLVWDISLYKNHKQKFHYAFTKFDILKLPFIFWLIVLGTTSILIVPYNYDSMIYHLARIENWIQNASVDYFITQQPRQLYFPVLTEYTIMHTFLLWHTDRLANLIQFSAYILSALFILNIGHKLNFKPAIKYLIFFLFLTIPMAIAESITTQTDLFATMWMLAFINIAIDLVTLKQLSFKRDTFILFIEGALICAFAYLSKGTVCIGISFFLLWIAFNYIKDRKSLKFMLFYGIVAIAIISIFAFPTFYRNYKSTGNILAPQYITNITIGNSSPAYLTLNFVKNYAMLANAPSTSQFLISLVTEVSNLLQIDLNHRDISMTSQFKEHIMEYAPSYHHDYTSCSYIAILWIICLIFYLPFCCFKASKIPHKAFTFFLFLAILSGMSIIRYQLWINRLILPYCILMVIFIGLVLNSLSIIFNKKFYLIALCLGIIAIPSTVKAFLFQTQYISQEELYKKYFLCDEYYYPGYTDLVKYINTTDSKTVGILLAENDLEYPLWKMLKNKKIIHIRQNDESPALPQTDYIIAINQSVNPDTQISYAGKFFKPIHFFKNDNSFAILKATSGSLQP